MERRALAKKPRIVAVAGAVVAGFIRLIKRTSSTVYDPLNFHVEVGAHQPFILAMWYGQFMMLADLNTPDFKVAAIVWRHGDGDFTAAILKRFGIELIRGAGAGRRKKDRGGAYAFRTALEALESGSIVCVLQKVSAANLSGSRSGVLEREIRELTLARGAGHCR